MASELTCENSFSWKDEQNFNIIFVGQYQKSIIIIMCRFTIGVQIWKKIVLNCFGTYVWAKL